MTTGCLVSTLAEQGPPPDVHTLRQHAGEAATRTAEGPGRALSARACLMCSAVTSIECLLDLGQAPVVVGETPVDPPGETIAPLRLGRCEVCGVLQVEDVRSDAARELIATATTQRTFAGRPDSARRFCEEAIDRWRLRGDGHVIEIGSGTGSLLRFFRAWQLPVLGIEADPRLTRYARLRRIPTWRAQFGASVAHRIIRAGMRADLLIVSIPTGAFPHVDRLFEAAATVVRPGGVLTLEVPDVLRIIGRPRAGPYGRCLGHIAGGRGPGLRGRGRPPRRRLCGRSRRRERVCGPAGNRHPDPGAGRRCRPAPRSRAGAGQSTPATRGLG